MQTFKLKILTPDEKLFEGQVLSFTVPTQAGEITVLKNHAPLVTVISIGELKVHTPGGVQDQKFLVQGGVIDIKESTKVENDFEVVILADQQVGVDGLENLDAEIARAKEAMQLKAEEIDFADEESALERNLFLKRFKQR